MTRIDPLDALFQTIRTRISGATFTWGSNVFANIAYVNAARPYVVFSFVAGGEVNRVRAQDAEYEIQIQVYSDSHEQAMHGAAVLSEQFRDQGELERGAVALNGGAEWIIVNCTQGRRISLIEPFGNTQVIYREGHVFRFRMEAR